MPTTNVRLDCGPQLQEIADVLAKSRKVVVITGAGISTNCGIPDFRSENGLYALIQAQYDAAARAEQVEQDIDHRPKKRRKLDRSCSTSAIPIQKAEVTPSQPKRQLRSSRSFGAITATATSPGPFPEEDLSQAMRQPANETTKPLSRRGRRASERLSPNRTGTSSLESDTPPSSQTSVSSTRQSLPNLKGKDLFDSIIWSDALTTSIFYTFISSLRHKIINDVKTTTETHKFIKALRDAGRLVRNYTQNIDMLESREGLCTELERGTGNRTRFSQKFRRESAPNNLPGESLLDSGVEVVHLHGSLDKLRCGLCAKSSSWDEDDRHQITLAGEAPDCPWCTANSAHREGRGRRSLAVGRLRPDIVLYGEEHPSAHLVAPLITHDLSLGPDVLLILGTSLRVHGLKVMVREFAKAVHARNGKVVFVNQTKPPESIWGDVIDYWVECDCDAWVQDLKGRRKEIWLPPYYTADFHAKEEKPKSLSKNPAATRSDVTNGAYLTMKIVDRLGKLSGRLPETTSNTKVPPKTSPASENESKRKRVSSTRPNAIRQNKENGAYLVFEIMASLRRLAAGSLESLPTRTGHTPLSPISANSPIRPRARIKDLSVCDSDLSQLPTPPNSDQAGPPMTPGTQRIKSLGSLSAILLGPFKQWREDFYR